MLDGVPTTSIDVPTPDGPADAILAVPGDDGPHPGVLLLMDAFGLRPRIASMAQRITGQGFVVLAPNLFHRAGRASGQTPPDLTDPAARSALFERLRPLMDELTPERAASDGGAYLDALAAHASGPAALVGYCMGGRIGWRIAAAHADRVAALGIFHGGGLVTDAPDSPHRSAGALRAEVYLGHADEDHSMTAEQIAVLEAALRDAGVTYTSELYAGAAHGYTMADTAAYDEAAAERHFAALFTLLQRTRRGV